MLLKIPKYCSRHVYKVKNGICTKISGVCVHAFATIFSWIFVGDITNFIQFIYIVEIASSFDWRQISRP